jgi:L-histidine N-alpha-methyltransferase
MSGPLLFLFLGGTIGNFSMSQMLRFLVDLRACMRPDDWLLLGADRVKDGAVLHAAYNDAAGVTAEFNLNLLEVLNRELAADFVPERFRHQARYNEAQRQIEMYLVSTGAQRVRLGALDTHLNLAEGERIRTEISRKFTRGGLEKLLAAAGYAVAHHYEPGNQYYSVVLAGLRRQ